MRIPGLALVALTLLIRPLWAQEISNFTLDNGMDVVVIEDHRAPVVVHMVWYRAGAADETPGVSGVAHFLEHLLFKATDDMKAGELSDTVAANGGSDNAFTSQDYTAYYQRVAADRLDLVMRMEADRMRDLRLTVDDIATERDVILEERNMRVENNPDALFGEQRRAAQYLNHPYGTPTIGWKHEVEKLSLEDALAYYRRFYAPNNAILVVAGDVDPANVLELAKKHYGPLAPTEGLMPRHRTEEPPQLAERRLTYVDPRVSQPYVIRTYLAPERNPGDQKQAAALTMLSELLGGNGQTSVLGRKLQFETQKAIYTSAFYDGMSLDKTTFGLVIVPSEGVSLAEGEAAMDKAVAEFIEEGVDMDQFTRIKMQIKADLIYQRDNVEAMANDYGAALTSGLTLEDIKAWPQVLQDVTPEEVIEAAKMLQDKRQAVTSWLTNPAARDMTKAEVKQ
ncbi:M16 family metallopeptidase [Profundibacter amoris]|uniref:Insulinase family protein n=1 Tax=Profundibacter amoris TaxID=2171755 RepID=A0A347UDD6_9RHOB|nr:pitrilysin family protein [Profundibacter amoris]AXX96864.1 insulinase family protein [Profundibacter amoris]